MKSQWSLGDLIIVRLYVRKDGAFYDPFEISKVELYDPNDNLISTITTGFNITNPSAGVYQITYQTGTDSTVGTWNTKWYIKYTGYDADYIVAERTFDLKQNLFDSSYGENYPLSFTFALLNDTFQKDTKMFIRLNVQEIYGRIWSIKNAKIKVQQFKNKYQILTTQDWTDADWINQEMIAIFDCTDASIAENYFAQVKLELSNGETILSPKLKLRVVDFVNQNAW